MGQEHRDHVAHLERRVSEAAESVAQLRRELREELFQQAKAFVDQITETRRDLFAALDRELAEGPVDEEATIGPH